MNGSIIKTALMTAGMAVVSAGAFAQHAQNGASSQVIPVKNGSVAANVKSKGMDKAAVARDIRAMLGLSEKHSLAQVAESSDKLGFTHVTYQQSYLGVPVDGATVTVHFRNGIADNVTGKIAQLGNMTVAAAVKDTDARRYAATYLNVARTIREYPANLVIAALNTSAGNKEYALVYKCRIDGRSGDGKVVMMNVFVDAASGKVLKAVNLIAHTDVNGTAHTLYSGTRTIVTDSTTDGYRLRDNARKIETYDVGGRDEATSGNIYFENPRDYYNESKDWNEKPALMEMTLTAVTNNMLTGLGFQNGKFVSSIAVKGLNTTPELVTWPDIKFTNGNTATLPISSQNVYVFPDGLDYTAGFGKLDLFGTQDFSDTAMFSPTTLTPGIYPWIDANNNGGTYTIRMEKNPALDAHWGMEMTHDYYSQVLNRNSYDGNGGVVRNFINGMWPMSFTQSNAAALPAPYFSMVYGLGDGENTTPFVGLDVMGHEFTHMVTESNGHGGLDYEGESGALNESFSDIFGTAIEFFTKGDDANWNIGEDLIIGGGFLRSMSSPKVAANPDTYEGQHWVDPSDLGNDNGGVHTNSGVQNKWFYLLTAGGTGTNDKGDAYTVTGIGIDKAAKIAYRNLTNYLTPQATYQDAYTGSLQAAADLYGGTGSNEYKSVKDAWFAVGIGERDTTTSVNEIAIGQNDLRLYPNPATGKVTIASDLSQTLDAEVLNVVGIPVMRLSISKGLNPVDISSLAKGVYMIRYNTGAKGYVQKLSVL